MESKDHKEEKKITVEDNKKPEEIFKVLEESKVEHKIEGKASLELPGKVEEEKGSKEVVIFNEAKFNFIW